jgi:hypothetical protein
LAAGAPAGPRVPSGGGDDSIEMKLLRQMVECCDGNISLVDVVARVVPACYCDWW